MDNVERFIKKVETKNIGIEPRLLIAVIALLIIYYYVFSSLGNNEDGNASSIKVFFETILWLLFVILILLNGISYIFGIDIIKSIKKLFGYGSDIDSGISLDDNDDIKLVLKEQVFHLPEQKYAYDAASAANPVLRKKLAPTGWHIPSDAEWTYLTTFLGGESSVTGGKMKETGTTHWNIPNQDATNSSGFTGLPGGIRVGDGSFSQIGDNGNWWSSSANDSYSAWNRNLNHNSGWFGRFNYGKKFGYSVRCLKGESPLFITTFETNSLKLYPNPVVGVLNIKVNYNVINQPYTIIDCLGRIVLNGKLNEVDNSINVEQLSKGIYYLKVSGNSASKFIKE